MIVALKYLLQCSDRDTSGSCYFFFPVAFQAYLKLYVVFSIFLLSFTLFFLLSYISEKK